MSTGHELGVDLAELWDAGQNQLPKVAGEFTTAVNALPTSITGIMYRSGGVGAGDYSYGSAPRVGAHWPPPWPATCRRPPTT